MKGRRHTPEQIVRKLHEADRLIAEGKSLAVAADEVIMHKLKPAGGGGGVVALDSKGNFAAPYNTPGMHRGWVTRDGKIHVRLCDE